MLKPKTTIDEMIKLLESKNIKFKLISKKEAKDYLIKNNNYYNITSYKKNFVKYQMGVNKGKYLNLDFAYLKDLGIIDFRLRMILFKMVNSIEHYLKLRILKYIELINEENGYDTVNEFLNEDYQNLQKIHNSIKRKISSIEYKNICDKYLNDDKLSNIPIWEFLEIITFGELINFYEFFIKKYHISGDIKYVYILREIKKLRNAVAHNDNILDDLNIQKDHYDFSENNIIEFLDNANISKKTKINKLRNNHIKQITYTLYMFNEMVTSDGIKYDVKRKLKKFFYKRIPMNKEYYKDNELLKSVYEYFDKLINFYY